MEHHDTDALGPRRRTLITGAGGQLGTALARVFAEDEVLPLDRGGWDVREPPPPLPWVPGLVLHAAAWTDVDGAETDPEGAAAANVAGTSHVAALGAPLVAYSSDYVFDGTKTAPYVESDAPAPLSVYGRTKLDGEHAAGAQAWIVRSSWLFSETGHNFVRTMLRLGADRDEVSVVADQRGCPTSTLDLAEAVLSIAPRLIAGEDVWGTYHFAGSGVTTWHDFASRIVAAQTPFTGHSPRVTPITTAEYPLPAPRPANSELDCSLFARIFGIRARPWTEETDRITRVLVEAQVGTTQHVA